MNHWNLHQLLIEYRLVRLPWKTFFQSLLKLKTCLPTGLLIPLLSKCQAKWLSFSSENTLSPPFLSAGFASIDSTKLRPKYLKKTSRKVPKEKLECIIHWALWNPLRWSDGSIYPAVVYMQISVICKYCTISYKGLEHLLDPLPCRYWVMTVQDYSQQPYL